MWTYHRKSADPQNKENISKRENKIFSLNNYDILSKNKWIFNPMQLSLDDISFD